MKPFVSAHLRPSKYNDVRQLSLGLQGLSSVVMYSGFHFKLDDDSWVYIPALVYIPRYAINAKLTHLSLNAPL